MREYQLAANQPHLSIDQPHLSNLKHNGKEHSPIRLEEVNYLEKGTLVWQIIGESDQSGKIIRRKLAQRCQIIIVPNASFRPDNQY